MPVLAGGRALLNELHANDGDLCKIFGVINAGPEIAQERAESAGGRFTIVPDPNRRIIAP